MNQNWIVENLNNAFSTWNGKLGELWGLVTTGPQTFKGGAVWSVMQTLHNGMVGIGYALVVLFFAISLCKTTMNFHELKRPEAAIHYLIRFVAAKALVGYGMDIMLNVFSICNGIVTDMADSMGGISEAMVSLPAEMQTAIENVGFLASIPLWLVTILGSLFITVLSFVMILTVYGRFFRLYMYTALAPLPLAAFAGESTQSVGISFLKSYVGVCLEGAVIVLACVIYSAFVSTPTVTGGEATTIVWSYLAETVFNMQLVYSGNFLAEAEADVMGRLRLSVGINPQSFCWDLEPSATFDTPEAVLVYSDSGIGTMTRRFHSLYRKHLIRSPYPHRQRPILINNWEATYYDFTDEKLVAIAKQAYELGIEMLVLDDGWFGKRNNDECSLGDWTVNEEKIKGGLKSLVERINAVGMKFGIWLEPEMVSPDSDLYREHPDWPIQIPGRHICLSRCQYVLDITRPEVEEYVYGCISRVLHSANIDYVKWDMNRCLANVGSAALNREHAGEFYHRYVLALYRLQERMLQEFPNLLLENCCGGGGRFDAGMLYYSPQIWTSDNMDPVQRLQIQEGTAMTYPLSTMGAHICCSKNHHTGRITPLKTRANVAMCGTFGYELDVTTLTEEEKQEVVQMNKLYQKYNDIYREGEYYRIASYHENHQYDCWQVVSEDKTECLVTYVQPGHEMVWVPTIFRLEGLIPDARYRLEGTDKIYSGEMLMNAGYRQEDLWGDYESVLLHFVVC